jgi:hypothetical protein
MPAGCWSIWLAKAAIDSWTTAAGITDGLVFRAMNNRHELTGNPLLAQNVMDAVIRYGEMIGSDRLAPHDLRTFAKLAHMGTCCIGTDSS